MTKWISGGLRSGGRRGPGGRDCKESYRELTFEVMDKLVILITMRFHRFLMSELYQVEHF